ncbi:respiratory nitrate reductase subunit gamma [Streptomyces sp. NPDC007205]
MMLIAFLPCSRLVHTVSAPVPYLFRLYTVCRICYGCKSSAVNRLL